MHEKKVVSGFVFFYKCYLLCGWFAASCLWAVSRYPSLVENESHVDDPGSLVIMGYM